MVYLFQLKFEDHYKKLQQHQADLPGTSTLIPSHSMVHQTTGLLQRNIVDSDSDEDNVSHDISTMLHSRLFTILTNPNHSHLHLPTPDLDLDICGLRQVFCLVLHPLHVCQLFLLVPSHHLCWYL